MTKDEKAIRDFCGHHADWWPSITQVQEMLALAHPKQKYHRGDRLICLETEEYCVIHISGTDRQWVKFPDSHIGVYTNEQVVELFELLLKEPEQEPVAWMNDMGTHIDLNVSGRGIPLYTTPPQIEVGCAECGVNGNHALYCVECAEKFVGMENENRSILIRTLKWCEDLLREAGHDEAVNEVQDCIMLLRKAQEK